MSLGCAPNGGGMAAMRKMEMAALGCLPRIGQHLDKRAAFQVRLGLLLRQIGEPEA